jgi:uncharacterized protein (TIGR03083 family)
MDSARWLDALDRDLDALVHVARSEALGAPVPSCPGWTLADLVHHVGDVLAFWGAIVGDELDGPEDLERPPRAADDELVPRLVAKGREASKLLRNSDPSAPCWTWSHQRDIAFVMRRLAQEIAVHRWDAESVAGAPQPIDAELASDGVDEFLEHFASWPAPEKGALSGTVHLHCTDVAGEWLVVQEGDHLTFTREHATGSCAIRGSASDLLLVVWGRVPLEAVEVIGDADVARRFVDWTQLG